jgi:hypothetical protein
MKLMFTIRIDTHFSHEKRLFSSRLWPHCSTNIINLTNYLCSIRYAFPTRSELYWRLGLLHNSDRFTFQSRLTNYARFAVLSFSVIIAQTDTNVVSLTAAPRGTPTTFHPCHTHNSPLPINFQKNNQNSLVWRSHLFNNLLFRSTYVLDFFSKSSELFRIQDPGQ